MNAGITEKTRALKAQSQFLLDERDFLLHLFDTSPGLMGVLRGAQHVFEFVNHRWFDLFGYDVVGVPMGMLLQDEQEQNLTRRLDDVFMHGLPYTGRGLRFAPPRHNTLQPAAYYLDLTCQPLFDNDGTISGVFVSGIDATESVMAQDRQRFLMDEMHHRIENVLATVSAIAANTLRRCESPGDFVEAFQSRLMALSRTHDALIRSAWEGPDLQGLLQAEFEPYNIETQITLAGEPVRLPPRSALSLGMVFHELAINASKYGALSVPRGRLDIRWQRLADPKSPLVLKWQESHGPAATIPRSHGFGSRLIERSITGELNGALTIEYEPAGLTCHIVLPHQALSG